MGCAGVVGLTACGGGDDSSAPAQGTLQVSMTDAPACGFDNVYVTVSKIRVNGNPDADESGSGWVDIPVTPARRIDLLSLTNGVLATLGKAALPAGEYQQIRLVLAPTAGQPYANAVVQTGGDGAEIALSTPSAAQSGYKIIRPFTVAPDTLTDLVLDFDACRSIVARGNGGFNLKPVVTAIPMVVSGKIQGYAPAGSYVYAERGGVVVKGTVATSAGAFTLSPVEQSSTAGDVDVVVVPPAQASVGVGIIRSVPVTAGTSTTVSTQARPILPPASAWATVSGTVTPLSAEATLRALQATGGATFEIASTFASPATGAYSMSLPVAGPAVGTYQTTLPIPLTQDMTAAGRYTVEAASAAGAVQSAQVDLGAGPATRDFAF
ncbi:MAG: DUF4382 domain-containing protein [Pigmentiphaga sp.]|uniref:DUF4382 domain-containing protein n=1 Tax=Pigmentiphaga sp. TaxID=1977564 RepID=UPI0029A33BDF|nr:DUF4382 domain-containing protein [Pigmentiphaga sp.]MDX3907935.1 DUF4382 domain-containing protein [Pigmentiphaga sp.]